MSSLTFNPSLETIEFEYLRKYLAQMMDVEVLDSKQLHLAIQDRIEYTGKLLIVDWKDMAHRLVDDKYSVKFYFPATPWQHFKAEHMPQWFRDRYPVRNKSYKRTVKFTRYATYPMANYKVQNPGKITIPFLGNVERIEDRVEEYNE